MPSSQGYELDEASVKLLAKMAREYQRKPKNQHPPRYRRPYSSGGGSSFRRIEFTLPAALTSADAASANCPVDAVWYGASPGASVTVYNDYGWESDAGATGIADFRPTDSRWVIVLLPCATGVS